MKERGKLIGAVDIMIAAISINRNSKLITKDKDFNNIKDNFPEFNLEVI